MTWDKWFHSNAVRVPVLLVVYSTAIVASRWFAYEVRFDFEIPDSWWKGLWRGLPMALVVKLGLLFAFGQFANLLSYFSIPDLRRVVTAVILSSTIIFLLRYAPGWLKADASRGVLLIDFILTVVALVGVRLVFRLLRERYLATNGTPQRRARRAGIVGAGDVGASLVRELQTKRGMGLDPVALFDDDQTKWGSRIHGVPVVGAPEDLLKQNDDLRLEELILAMPSASAKRVGEIAKMIRALGLKFETVPSVEQLTTGRVRITQLRSVDIQDLLGRAPVRLETENIRQLLRDRPVMVTGAGGSIGSELSRQVAAFNPKRLLLVDQSEVQLFQIEQELIEQGYGGIILPLIIDILDQPRLEEVFGRFRPAVIFHAAAHKHVPMMESQPSEAIKNNVFGTALLAETALEHDAERFVLISTDKAINPTSVMGATKRLAEIYVQSLYAQHPGRTRFMAVRFGNVLGSSGSVIPIFQKQIAGGGPVRVTHPDVTRYFMTIPEASGLVLQSAALGAGGEIFVLDMGEPIKIVDLARQLIELSGLRPEEDILIEFSGLRPGEKLFEELSHTGEQFKPTTHPKISRFVCEPQPFDEISRFLAEFTPERLHQYERNQLKLMLQKAVPEYQPYLV